MATCFDVKCTNNNAFWVDSTFYQKFKSSHQCCRLSWSSTGNDLLILSHIWDDNAKLFIAWTKDTRLPVFISILYCSIVSFHSSLVIYFLFLIIFNLSNNKEDLDSFRFDQKFSNIFKRQKWLNRIRFGGFFRIYFQQYLILSLSPERKRTPYLFHYSFY